MGFPQPETEEGGWPALGCLQRDRALQDLSLRRTHQLLCFPFLKIMSNQVFLMETADAPLSDHRRSCGHCGHGVRSRTQNSGLQRRKPQGRYSRDGLAELKPAPSALPQTQLLIGASAPVLGAGRPSTNASPALRATHFSSPSFGLLSHKMGITVLGHNTGGDWAH